MQTWLTAYLNRSSAVLAYRRGSHLVLTSIMAITRKEAACAARRDAGRDSPVIAAPLAKRPNALQLDVLQLH